MEIDQALKLLETQKAIILPEDLDHDCYVLIQMACLMYADDTLSLYCRGDGGSCRTANAIVDVIQAHGKVRGILAGEADSSHGIIFAGCPERYVYPHGAIGVHRTTVMQIDMVDAPYARNRHDDLEAGDQLNARILASACPTGSDLTADWWYKQIDETGKGLRLFDSAFLVSKGIAKPASELKGMSSGN
jgi:ATP-dependent protease ClpP protease subunit